MTPATIAMNRFGLGVRPDAPTAGDPRAWLLAQLTREPPAPTTSPTRSAADTIAAQRQALRDLREQAEAETFAARRLAADKDQRRALKEMYATDVRARLDMAVASDTPLVDRLVFFWSNHFAISARKPELAALAWGYESEAIRPHVLGRFRDLLRAAEQHPAMLIYLNGTSSAGPDSPAARHRKKPIGLNENLAREILELHTLGVRTGYTQADVTEFARALTGWTTPAIVPGAPAGVPGAFAFDDKRHQPGARTIIGRTYAEGGREQAEAVLDDLARHPATARHIATKLTRHFAGAPEPAAMVDRLAAAFTRSDGDLTAVYRALIASPEAWVARPVRFRTPWEWSVAVLRAGGGRGAGAPVVGMFEQLGQPVWVPPQPSGWDDDDAAWAAPDALMRRVEEAERLSNRVTEPVDARALAGRLFPGGLSPATTEAIARADSPGQALALLYCSPEMMRR